MQLKDLRIEVDAQDEVAIAVDPMSSHPIKAWIGPVCLEFSSYIEASAKLGSLAHQLGRVHIERRPGRYADPDGEKEETAAGQAAVAR